MRLNTFHTPPIFHAIPIKPPIFVTSYLAPVGLIRGRYRIISSQFRTDEFANLLAQFKDK